MTGPTIFADGIVDVHIANGVARITLGAVTGQQDQRPAASGTLILPVVQLPTLVRVLGEVTRQMEERAKEAMAKAQAGAAAPGGEAAPATGAFRFNG
jgi:predicted ATPase